MKLTCVYMSVCLGRRCVCVGSELRHVGEGRAAAVESADG